MTLTYPYDSVFDSGAELMTSVIWETGSIQTGSEPVQEGSYIINGGGDLDDETSKKRTGFIGVYPSVKYKIINPSSLSFTVHFYTMENRYLGYATGSGTEIAYTTPANTRLVRLVTDVNASVADCSMRSANFQNSFVVDEEEYVVLGRGTGYGKLKGIIPLMGKFQETADLAYITKLGAMQAAQAAVKAAEGELINTLGDIYREGYWQKADYVDGDEEKLYYDAIENLEKIAKPATTYAIQYLDLYMTMNRRTANYVKVDHDGYIYFKNPDASKFNLRIVQYNLDYTVRETQGLAHIETFCFMNSSDVMYKIQISARYTDTEMPTLSDCHVGVYYPVQFISGLGSSEPKNTYCIMTHNIGQWTTGSGTKMTDNVHSWIDLHDAIIERYNPDVLCLQEYLPYESITGNYYENSYTFNSPNNNVYSGKCILSNMPLENSTGGVYSNQASGNIACNWAKSYVWLGGHKVAIIATHLSTTLEKAQLQNAELKALADNEE